MATHTFGANDEWIPGGFTPTSSEAVINAVEWNKVEQSVIVIKKRYVEFIRNY